MVDEGSVVVEGRSKIIGVKAGRPCERGSMSWSSEKESSGSAESRMENIFRDMTRDESDGDEVAVDARDVFWCVMAISRRVGMVTRHFKGHKLPFCKTVPHHSPR